MRTQNFYEAILGDFPNGWDTRRRPFTSVYWSPAFVSTKPYSSQRFSPSSLKMRLYFQASCLNLKIRRI
jgi:hypothetical protein